MRKKKDIAEVGDVSANEQYNERKDMIEITQNKIDPDYRSTRPELNNFSNLMLPEYETSMYDPYGNLLIVSQEYRHPQTEPNLLMSSQPISYDSFANSILNSSESLHVIGGNVDQLSETDISVHQPSSKSKSLSPFIQDRNTISHYNSKSKSDQRASECKENASLHLQRNFGSDDIQQPADKEKPVYVQNIHQNPQPLSSSIQTGCTRESVSPPKPNPLKQSQTVPQTIAKKESSVKNFEVIEGRNESDTVTKTRFTEEEDISGYYKKDKKQLQTEKIKSAGMISSQIDSSQHIPAKRGTESDDSKRERLSISPIKVFSPLSNTKSEQIPPNTDINRQAEVSRKSHPTKTRIEDQVPSLSFTVDPTPSPPPTRSKVVDNILMPKKTVTHKQQINDVDKNQLRAPLEKSVKPLVLPPPKVSNLCLEPGERRSLDYSQFEFRKSGTPFNSNYQSVFKEKEQTGRTTRPKSIYEMINMKGPTPYQSTSEVYEDVHVQQMSRSTPFLNEVLVGDVQESESLVILEQIQNAKAFSKLNDSSEGSVLRNNWNLFEEDAKGAPGVDTNTSPSSVSTEESTAATSSKSSHKNQSIKESITSSTETKMSATETISKAAISEIVVTVPQEVVWKEEDQLLETRVEKKIVISHDEELDHDQALADAIRQATKMNPDLTVEKIEIRMENERSPSQ